MEQVKKYKIFFLKTFDKRKIIEDNIQNINDIKIAFLIQAKKRII